MPRVPKRLPVPHDDPLEKLILPKTGGSSRKDAALKPTLRGLPGRSATWLTSAPKGGRGVVQAAPTMDARRRVVAKMRYWNKYQSRGKHASKLGGLGNYLGRLKGDGVFIDEEGHSAYLTRESPFFSERSDHLSASDVTQAAANDHRTFELIINPHDGRQLVSKDFIRSYMREVEQATGTRLAWFAVIHRADTPATKDNLHAHILIRGKDYFGKQVWFNDTFVKDGFRGIAERMATERQGPMTAREMERFRAVRELNRERDARLNEMKRDGVSMAERRRFSKEWKERGFPGREQERSHGRSMA